MSQSLLYIAAGVNHFWHPEFYLKIMPPYLPAPAALIFWSGAAEIAGGLGLGVPRLRKQAAIGVVAMLTAYMPVHVYMVRHPDRFPAIPYWALVLRFPVQAALAWWAWSARQ